MDKFYYVKLSCPKESSTVDNTFLRIVQNFKRGYEFSEILTNIPNKLAEAQNGEYVFLQLGGDISNKRKYFGTPNEEYRDYKNGWYAVGKIINIDSKRKQFEATFFPFNSPIEKLDLYLYPQFIDNLGCTTKGTPNQAGLYEMDPKVAYSFIEFLLLNSKVEGESQRLLKELNNEGVLESTALDFYGDNSKLLSEPTSHTIIDILTRENTKDKVVKSGSLSFKINDFINALDVCGLLISDTLPYRFISSLQTKPFLILSGLSGSGKTKLAEAFVLWSCENNNQICMVAVGADWTNREPLLGFPNALEKNQYVKPDSGVLDLVIAASKDPTRPYFLILDEMNMSHVERYFADFLSAMESSDGMIKLHSGSEDWNGVPPTINLPKNLFIIGTVNIDETTYMFSPKVLDRANVIEFRVSDSEMTSFFDAPKALNMDVLRGAGASMAESFVAKALEKNLVDSGLGDELMPFFRMLQKAGAEFGYRTATEMSRFVSICDSLAEGIMDRNTIVDAAIMQKLLPKLHGSRNKIEPILKELGRLCLDDPSQEAFLLDGAKTENKYTVKYKLSYDKLMRMHERVIADGFTSFAEA